MFLRAPEGRKRKIAILGAYSRKIFESDIFENDSVTGGGGWGKPPALRNARQIDSQRYGWVGGGGKKIAIVALRNFWTAPYGAVRNREHGRSRW